MPRRGRDISVHAIDRCADRHGFIPSVEQGRAMTLDIQAGRSLLLARLEEGRDLHLVELWPGVMLRVIYARDSATILTILPHEATHRISDLPTRQSLPQERAKFRRGARAKSRTVWLHH